MKSSFENSEFQLWEFKVSHGSLLIRSPKGPETPKNIDLVQGGPGEFHSFPDAVTACEDAGNVSIMTGAGWSY